MLQQRRSQLTQPHLELKALTGVRLLAAMYVVLYHSKLAELFAERRLYAASNLMRNGAVAVSLFFILSGFILSYNYVDQIGAASDWRRFWEARFARIWPMYALSLLFSTLTLHTTPTHLRALATIFMVQAWNPLNYGAASAWNFVCWTLSVEAFFYLLFPFIQLWLGLHQFLIGAVLLGSTLVATLFCTARIDYNYHPPFHGIPLALCRLPEFLIGMCLGNIFRLRIHKFASNGLWTWSGALGCGYILMHLDRLHVQFIVLGFGALVFGLATESTILCRALSTPALNLGGRLSYGIYLLQWPCKAVVNYGFDQLNLKATAAVRSVTDCCLLIGISYITFNVIENPVHRLLRTAFARWESRRYRLAESRLQAVTP